MKIMIHGMEIGYSLFLSRSYQKAKRLHPHHQQRSEDCMNHTPRCYSQPAYSKPNLH